MQINNVETLKILQQMLSEVAVIENIPISKNCFNFTFDMYVYPIIDSTIITFTNITNSVVAILKGIETDFDGAVRIDIREFDRYINGDLESMDCKECSDSEVEGMLDILNSLEHIQNIGYKDRRKQVPTYVNYYTNGDILTIDTVQILPFYNILTKNLYDNPKTE